MLAHEASPAYKYFHIWFFYRLISQVRSARIDFSYVDDREYMASHHPAEWLIVISLRASYRHLAMSPKLGIRV